jgi:hypothetical protein
MVAVYTSERELEQRMSSEPVLAHFYSDGALLAEQGFFDTLLVPAFRQRPSNPGTMSRLVAKKRSTL